MHEKVFPCVLALLAAACAPGADINSTYPAPTTAFENARLVIGDGSVIEQGTLVIQEDRVLQVGRTGGVQVPAGARRVDIAGKTIIPALIDAHAHLGFEGYTSWGGENYTRENVLDHLERYAYYGFGTVMTTGTDPAELIFGIQRQQAAGAIGGARVLFAAGMAPPNAGPNPQMLEATRALAGVIVHAAADPEQARQAVREIATQSIPFIKIWVDDRSGAQPKLERPIYEAIIEEAGRHGIEVLAHQQTIADMKALAAAGVAGFLHGRLGDSIDDEVVELMRRRGTFLVPNIGLTERGRERISDDPHLQQSLAPEVIQRLREGYSPRPAATPEQERALRDAFQKFVRAGVPIVLGTDAGAVPDHFFGYTGHRELEIYVRLGMSPLQALTAATGTAAEQLGLDDRGILTDGRSADFVILDANPLTDIRNTRSIADVYLRGERVDRERLRAKFTGE